jgi:glycerophosphoryl diester phosphodiesterase
MEIVEKFILSKKPDQSLCEDGYFISDDFVAVVDGASAKSGRLYDDKSAGRVAREYILKAIAGFRKNITAEKAVESMTNALAEFYKSKKIYKEMLKNYQDRPTASVIVYSAYRKELWLVGDCQAVADGIHIKNEKLVDKIADEARAYYLRLELQKGKTVEQLLKTDAGRKFIAPLLENQGIFQNCKKKCEYCHGVIDGTEVPKQEIKVVKIDSTKNLILASDGYPKLFSTLAESEKYLAKVLKEDPLCIEIHKTSHALLEGYLSFDDRTYIKIKI